MSDSSAQNRRVEKAAASDASLQRAHDTLIRQHAEFNEHGSKLPLFLLGFGSVMIFLAAIYMVHHRGGFDPLASDPRFDPRTAVAAAAVKVDPVAEGEKLFNSICVTCHQAQGQGVPGVFPPLAGSEWVGNDERVVRILLSGLQGPVTVKGGTYGAAAMPAFGPGGYGWSDEKISYVLTYVRQAWGNKSGPITAEQVAAIRGKIGQRAAWSATELEAIK